MITIIKTKSWETVVQ